MYVCVEGSRGPLGLSAFFVLGRADAAITAKISEGGCKWQDFKVR